MKSSRRAALCVLATAARIATAGGAEALPPSSAQKVNFHIEQQPVGNALTELGLQSGLTIVVASAIGSSVVTPRLDGDYTPAAALDRLLKQTGLSYEYLDRTTVAVVAQNRIAGREAAHLATADERANAESTAEHAAESPRPNDVPTTGPDGQVDYSSSSEKALRKPLDEIVVTGTHIRGTDAPVGAQLIVIDRSEIQRSGYSQVQELFGSLPQNVLGDVRNDTLFNSGGRTGATNSSSDAAPNLRGLGSEYTLVLLNGRRMAPGGTAGAFTGISSIPLTAIERVEILPDGASALYGSDAVGGVVNLITRKDYQGLETSVHYGGAVGHALDEIQVSQAGGLKWNKGNAMIALEFDRQKPLPADSRRQMNSDLTPFGGTNFDINQCNPGTIQVGGQSYAIPAGQNGRALIGADLIPGTENLCNRNAGSDLIGLQKRWNVLGSVDQQVFENLAVFGDVLYADRKVTTHSSQSWVNLFVPNSNPFFVDPTGSSPAVTVQYNLSDDLGAATSVTDAKTMNAGVGGKLDFGAGWALTLQLGFARERQNQTQFTGVDSLLLNAALSDSDPSTAFNPFGDGSNTNPATLATLRGSQSTLFATDSRLWTANGVFDGPVMALPGGELKAALGFDYRRQTFVADTQNLVRSSPEPIFTQESALARHVTAVFGELLLPIFGPDNRRPGLYGLNVSAAGRYEKYSDFGSASVPRIGVAWSPVSGLTVRGTWSKSYKAPNLADLSEAANYTIILPEPDPASPFGSSNALLVGANNSQLKAETAKVSTVGVEVAPSSLPQLNLSATYFDINFSNRISSLPNQNYFGDPINAPAVTRSPNASQVAAVCNSAAFLGNYSGVGDIGDCATVPVDAIVDLRLRNLAAVRERGLDLRGAYSIATPIGRLISALNATYLFRFAQQLTPAAPLVDVVNTATFPIDLKIRGSIGWSNRGYSVTTNVNFANSYKDTISIPNRTIGSWTTVDLNLAYHFDTPAVWALDRSSISLSALNLFNKQPPFYNNAVGLGFDPQNATLVGRVLSIDIRKQW